MSRREILKYGGLAVAVSLTGIPSLAEDNLSNEKEKAKVISEMMQGVIYEKECTGYVPPSPEIKRQMGEIARNMGPLCKYMNSNHKAIFDHAPKGEDYVLGIYRGQNQRPEIHYFSNKTDAIKFGKKQSQEVINLRYRNQGDFNHW